MALLMVFFMGIKVNAQKQLTLQKNMHINQSAIIQKKIYDFPGNDSLKMAVIEISGDDIVIDFNGAVLDGSKNKYSPDAFTGTALRILKSKNVTIKNAVIKGYKIALFAKNVQNLHIENCDFSYNFRQHLNSNREREDLSDWQSYHHNEQDEWTRFGAGMYLRNCDSVFIKNNSIQNGQCGLMMTGCNDGLIYNNNFSFNSGIGIGFYKSSNNRVMNNQLDWNIRGVSDGVYYRGQDAAAILVYEQSNENIFAWNSATHSGDGFFLWAGQTTMDSGTGGCNDNLIFQNDFSYAPTNGVEVTFSRNTIIGNKIFDCAYGVCGGYSYNSLIAANHFKNNNTGIAIEQGQENNIENNYFEKGKTAIRLWETPGRKMEGKYDELRDVSSMKYIIKNNFFDSEQTVFDISHSEMLSITGNKILHAIENMRLDSTVKNIFMRGNGEKINFIPDTFLLEKNAPQKLPDARNAMLPADHLQGKKYMMMTEWGPYDFQSPILWLT
ncbi:MAG: right-handed parallel beta-helix repeat-containing protein, partial [Bacteroidota bacterium]